MNPESNIHPGKTADSISEGEFCAMWKDGDVLYLGQTHEVTVVGPTGDANLIAVETFVWNDDMGCWEGFDRFLSPDSESGKEAFAMELGVSLKEAVPASSAIASLPSGSKRPDFDKLAFEAKKQGQGRDRDKPAEVRSAPKHNACHGEER